MQVRKIVQKALQADIWAVQRLTGFVSCSFRQERLMHLAFFEIEDQHAKLHVRRIERNKLACMGKRGGEKRPCWLPQSEK